jgi:small subunit ribosomal protein S13|tara:strand:+ start:972 stop:1325 length:354 start_codon:yes stop_codon:yes gene_type:complete
MPRLLNVQIPDEKRVLVGLTYIPGIGLSRSKLICSKLSINEGEYMKQLTKNQLSSITSYIRKYYKTGPKVYSDQLINIRRLINISSYKGLRHFKGLPVRGQRTKTNAQTSRKLRRKI